MAEIVNDDSLKNGGEIESIAHDNSMHYWLASELGAFFGYDSYRDFKKIIKKGMDVCTTQELPVADHFQQILD